MAQVGLNLDLAAHLFLDFACDQFGFVQHFERADVAGLFFAREVDTPEFAFAERSADFEVVQVEEFGLGEDLAE